MDSAEGHMMTPKEIGAAARQHAKTDPEVTQFEYRFAPNATHPHLVANPAWLADISDEQLGELVLAQAGLRLKAEIAAAGGMP
jgi:hypothetical protein